jgi:ribonucleotide monophosphatase NagD (HAD superfamily)
VINAGIDSAFVLSGEGTLEDLKTSETKPTYIYQNIREILNDIEKNG